MTQTQALVVGASSEIGRAVAVELADLGHRPVLWGRDAARLQQTADACGGTAAAVDVTDREALARAVDEVVSPGLVAAGAGLRSPAGQERPHELLQPADVAAAVRFVVAFPGHGCPTEVRLEPLRTP